MKFPLLLLFTLSATTCFTAPGDKEKPLVPAAPTKAMPTIKLNLPQKIHTVPGIEANIYFDNVTLTVNPKNFIFDVTCNRGSQQEERWTYIPSDEDVGQFTLTLRVLDGQNQVVAEAATTIVVSPRDAGKGGETSILIIGDSLTNASVYPKQVYDNCQGENNPKMTMVGSTFRGRKPTGPEKHEGYGGWTAQRFMTYHRPDGQARTGKRSDSGSPFIYKQTDGSFEVDFQHYFDDMSKGIPPEFITILLGCNDTFSSTDETIESRIDTMFKHYENLIAAIHKCDPKIKIGALLLVPGAASQDAFGANYKCGQTRWQYKRNQYRVVERMQETFGNREKENVYLVAANVNLDCEHNYPRKAMPWNSRTALKTDRLNNGVHPASEGYKQIGDSIYCWLKAQLAAEK